MAWPAAIAAGAAAVGAGADLYSAFQSGEEGMSRADQRFIADFQWKQSLREEQRARDNDAFNRAQSLRNEEWQKYLAQHGISMRAKDAMEAGFHPLTSLGVNPASGGFTSNVMAGGPSGVDNAGGGRIRGSPVGDVVSRMGQNISRAAMAVASENERLIAQANLDKARADVDYVRAMTAESLKRTASIGQNPPLPIDPYGFSGDARVTPNQHQVFRTPDGYRIGWSDEFNRSMSGRPLSVFAADIGDIFAGPDARRVYGWMGERVRDTLMPWRRRR